MTTLIESYNELLIAHDQTEAMTLGDRIVIMKDGFVQQVEHHKEVFNRPANLFVAGFIGMPQIISLMRILFAWTMSSSRDRKHVLISPGCNQHNLELRQRQMSLSA